MNIAAETSRQRKPKEEPAAPSNTPRNPETVNSITDLMKACHDDFKLQPKAVLAELGVVSQSELTESPAECYIRIASVRQ
jgi:hypothetical protein